MEKIKKLNVFKIANYIFIIYCIILIGHVMFVIPATDNVFNSNLLIVEVWAAMSIEQLGLIIGISLVSMICVVLAMLKSNEEKIVSKRIITYLIMIIISTIILCVSCIYMYHSCKMTALVIEQVQVCVDELKENSLNPSQISINKVKTSTDNKSKYRYITIDYSTNRERKIVIYKVDNKNTKILKQYEADDIEYATSLLGFGALYDELDIDIEKIK